MSTMLIENHRAEIEDLCRGRPVPSLRRASARCVRLDVFGSVLREDFDPARSDVDLLVEYQPSVVPSLSAYFDLRDALSRLLGRPVDLVMARALRNPYIKATIESERRSVYVA